MPRFTPHVLCLALGMSLAGGWGCGRAGEPEKEAKFPKQILLIRHGEKPADDTEAHLSKEGKERAKALPRLFEKTDTRPDPFPTPDFVFAARNSSASHRPFDTVRPLAKQLNLTIDDTFESKVEAEKADGKGVPELAAALLGESKYAGKTVLVSWRHSTIPELAKALHAKKVPSRWADEVFDRVWQITYDEKGKGTLRDRPQRLLTTDSEK